MGLRSSSKTTRIGRAYKKALSGVKRFSRVIQLEPKFEGIPWISSHVINKHTQADHSSNLEATAERRSRMRRFRTDPRRYAERPIHKTLLRHGPIFGCVYVFTISIEKQQGQIIFIRLHAFANERATKFSAEAARRFNLCAVLKLVLAEALFIIRAAASSSNSFKTSSLFCWMSKRPCI